MTVLQLTHSNWTQYIYSEVAEVATEAICFEQCFIVPATCVLYVYEATGDKCYLGNWNGGAAGVTPSDPTGTWDVHFNFGMSITFRLKVEGVC